MPSTPSLDALLAFCAEDPELSAVLAEELAAGERQDADLALLAWS